jgi:CheY-like chemotaxis protein/anti-sigma regulatory factor (Ser/Thr protein kinase)
MPNVLVVDDAPLDRFLAGSLLEAHTDLTAVYAEDGKEALDAIRQEAPDLVLTDLQMPAMNGLELVEAVRRSFPYVPVILMTAHGSEEIAVQALRAGAASYVPKKNLAHDLVETVERVLAVSRAGRNHHRLWECLADMESQFILPNDSAYLAPLIGHLQDQMGQLKLCDKSNLIRVGNALHEVLVNAIEHGNLELSSTLREGGNRTAYLKLIEERRRQVPYRDRRVYVTARFSHTEAVYVIRDEGPGFDPSTLPDPTDPCNLEKTTGRGLLLIHTFMDDVRFNATGNEITIVKRRV